MSKVIFLKSSKKKFFRKNQCQKIFFAQELLKNFFLTWSHYIPKFMQLYMHFFIYYNSFYNYNRYIATTIY